MNIIRKAQMRVYKYLRFVTYLKQYSDYMKLSKNIKNRFSLKWKDRLPCLYDNTNSTDFDRHYIYHTAWAARILEVNKPEIHIDLSSSLYFCSIVSAFIPMRFYDYRPPQLRLNNLSVDSADICKLPFEDKSINSLSCMHVIEHIGLGRYGDPLDPNGDIIAIEELGRVMASDGNLLLVVPVGKPRICFNAHRIYSYEHITSMLSSFNLKQFALIPDNADDGGLIINPTPEFANKQCYSCGCFWFIKK